MALRASFTLAAALYIAAADTGDGGDFPLSVWLLTAKAVAETDHELFLIGQYFVNSPEHLPDVFLAADLLQKVLVFTNNIHQRQCGIVIAGFDIIRQRHILTAFPLGAEVHQDFICYPLPKDF